MVELGFWMVKIVFFIIATKVLRLKETPGFLVSAKTGVRLFD